MLSGARVLDIAKHLPTVLSKHNAFRTVVIYVGTNDISDQCSEVPKEHYWMPPGRRQMPGLSSLALFPPTGGDLSGSAGSLHCSPGSAAGGPSTAWATWTTALCFGSSQRSTGGMGFTLVV
ncbi:hypothetical protein SRHO_G00142760 [Serrasalmus rhombeus]